MAGKQYEVARYFRRTDPQTGIDTYHNVEDDYSGPVDDGYLDPQGPDGYGPLIVDKAEKAAAEKAVAEEKAAADKAAAAEDKAVEKAVDKAAAAEEKAAAEKPTPASSDSSNKEK